MPTPFMSASASGPKCACAGRGLASPPMAGRSSAAPASWSMRERSAAGGGTCATAPVGGGGGGGGGGSRSAPPLAPRCVEAGPVASAAAGGAGAERAPPSPLPSRDRPWPPPFARSRSSHSSLVSLAASLARASSATRLCSLNAANSVAIAVASLCALATSYALLSCSDAATAAALCACFSAAASAEAYPAGVGAPRDAPPGGSPPLSSTAPAPRALPWALPALDRAASGRAALGRGGAPSWFRPV